MVNGKRLQELRENAKLSTAQLAEIVGVSQPMISQMESGLKTPKLEVMARIAKRLGTTVDGLINEPT